MSNCQFSDGVEKRFCGEVGDFLPELHEFLQELEKTGWIAELAGISSDPGHCLSPKEFLRKPENTSSGTNQNTQSGTEWFSGECWPKEEK